MDAQIWIDSTSKNNIIRTATYKQGSVWLEINRELGDEKIL